MSDAPERLYGEEHAEQLYFAVGDWYESAVEQYHDEHDRRPVPFVEYSVHPPSYHLPDPEALIEYIVETGADTEGDEVWYEYATEAARDPEVRALLAEALEAIAARIVYRMADKVVARHELTWDDDGQPLVDGEPLYRKAG